jgi:hypothetical protein
MKRFAGYVNIVQVLHVDGVMETRCIMWVSANRRNLCVVDRAKRAVKVKI